MTFETLSPGQSRRRAAGFLIWKPVPVSSSMSRISAPAIKGIV